MTISISNNMFCKFYTNIPLPLCPCNLVHEFSQVEGHKLHGLLSQATPAAKMVNVMKGVLVECDPAMKQFLLHLDDTNALGKKFVLQDLDDTHMFISADIVEILQDKIDDLMDRLSFPLAEK